MAFTYDLSTDIGKQRLACGDTIATDILLQDDEHQVCIDLYGANAEAQLQALYAIRAKWMRDFDRSSIGLSASRSQRFTQVSDVIKTMESIRNRRAVAYLYGTLTSEKTSERSDPDRIQPVFRRGQFDHSGSSTDDDSDGSH